MNDVLIIFRWVISTCMEYIYIKCDIFALNSVGLAASDENVRKRNYVLSLIYFYKQVLDLLFPYFVSNKHYFLYVDRRYRSVLKVL
jgi:hypothetical protein